MAIETFARDLQGVDMAEGGLEAIQEARLGLQDAANLGEIMSNLYKDHFKMIQDVLVMP